MIAPRLALSGLMSHGRVSIIFIAEAIEPAAMACFQSPSLTEDEVRSGMYNNQLKQLDPERVEVVKLSDGLVDILHLAVGGQAAVLANTPAGQANALDITVGHAFNAGFDVEIQTWRDLPDFYNQVSDLFDMIFGFIFLIVLTVVIMSVVERTREIGTLRAIGLKRAGVVRLFTTESLLLTLLGCTLGLLITIAVRWGINPADVSCTPPNSASPVPLLISLDAVRMTFTFALMGVVGTIAAYLPARRAAKKLIIDALGQLRRRLRCTAERRAAATRILSGRRSRLEKTRPRLSPGHGHQEAFG